MTLTKMVVLAGVLAQAGFGARFDYKVRNDFFAGFAGDSAALERAMKASEAAIAENETDAAEALAWHGGGLMFLSGVKFKAGDMAAGADFWAKGVAEMEKGGAMAPDNPGVLIPRAAVWFAVSRQSPPQMGEPLLKKAIADYEHVYEIQQPFFEKLGMHPRSELLFGLADGYRRTGNTEKARMYFTKLTELGPGAGHRDQAQAYLEGKTYEVQGPGCVGCHTGK